MKASVLFLFVASFSVLASGDSHHGSIGDLLAPSVNFLILFVVLVWKIKGPLKMHFDKLSLETSEEIEKMEGQHKEVELNVEKFEKKLSHFPKEKEQILSNVDDEVKRLEKEMLKDKEIKAEKMKKDADNKVLSEERKLWGRVYEEEMDKIISLSQQKISSDKNLRESIENDLIGKIVS